MRPLIIGLFAGALAVCSLSQSTFAMQESPNPGTKKGDPPSDLLSGPKVEAEATQQRNNPGRPNAGNADQRREVEIPFQQWAATLRGLGLSQDQLDKARAIVGEFQQANREFQAEHGEEMRQLFAEIREARQDGIEPAKDAREKMRQFEEARPKPEEFKQRIWTLLNDQQQNQMKERLDALRKEMTDRRAGRRDGRQSGGDGEPDSMMKDPSAGALQRDAMNTPGEMVQEQPAVTPNRPRADRKTAAKSPSSLSDASRRRLQFLLAHQSAADQHRRAPTDEQRRFDFTDSNDQRADDAETRGSPNKP